MRTVSVMRTVVLGPPPAELEVFLARRHELGLDDFRIPDSGVFATGPDTTFVPTAVLVLEVVSPDDETFEKFGFYAAHGVQEIFTADPREQRVRIWAGDGYDEADISLVLKTTAAALTSAVRWPA